MVISIIYCILAAPRGFVKTQIAGPHLQSFWSKKSGWGLGIGITKSSLLILMHFIQGPHFKGRSLAILQREFFKVHINSQSQSFMDHTWSIFTGSVSQLNHSILSDHLWPHGLQHARLPCPSPTPGVYSNSCPLSQSVMYPAISSSIVPFSSRLQSFQEPGSFTTSQFFVSGGQSIGVSASASVLPVNIQDQFPLGWTGWISLLSKGLSRVFSNTTVQKHQFFGTQLSL